MKKEKRLLLGAHVSISGGLFKAFERAQHLGCTCMQIFTKSNRQWYTKPLSQQEIEEFKQAHKNSSISPTLVHASYLINIGSSTTDAHKKAVDALIQELQRTEQLGIPYLIFHPGSNPDEQEGIARIVQGINAVLKEVPGDTMILIENTAGQGSAVGYTFEQLKKIYDGVLDKKRVGICLDTCHLFAAGYDFTTPATYKKMWEDFDNIIGLKTLKAIHLNDSKKECGSNVDRHANIGKGKIGLEAFNLLFNDSRFDDIPKILETPKDADGHYHYEQDIATIKKLLN